MKDICTVLSFNGYDKIIENTTRDPVTYGGSTKNGSIIFAYPTADAA
jgi:hypothetical protein